MKDVWVIDGHCDSILDFLEGKRSLTTPQEGGHWDIQRAKEGKVMLQFMAAFIESQYKPERGTLRGLELIHAVHRFIQINGESVVLVRQAEDLRRLAPSQVGCLLSIEGGEILGNSLFLLDIIYELGVRALGLTWNQRNAIADGAGELTQSALTQFGEKVIQRMNELGMLIDVSHLNEAGFWHVLKLSTQPILASHSCAYALCPHPRNLTDEQLKALAQNGGVVGVNFYPGFLTQEPKASLQDVVRHIQYIAEVAGVDVIGLGSDFDGIESTPAGLEGADKYGDLAKALHLAGFNDQEIEKIMYKNFMRLLSTVLK
ncbi:dipeptidase [Desulfitobacterium chlororespirans]|uniref:Dipeptidase. Metallo peptidase. MEROPS family M19 n=1 Tax=Desulfitobacterium chlororespirans DSM 11544 TaxID=1121395 RepID=A0A1M7UGF9_9FIRM|nr:dipeptidase [Desulfitobacterium chlororespirans]SHN82069.1 dipeptidase. Metallo peptidase. MEROPS family M19 [Desulfitobacterium chlororespirans DSM 11544]